MLTAVGRSSAGGLRAAGAVRLLLAATAAGVCCAAGCGQSLVGYSVTLQPSSECSLTGPATQSCTDEDTLAARSTAAHWVIESAPDGAFAVTLTGGETLPGVTFPNDGVNLNVDGCASEGGTCFFARRRFQSTDARNNNCARFGETVLIVHTAEQGVLTGTFAERQGQSAECGTPTFTELVERVTATPTATPSEARLLAPSSADAGVP